MALRRLFIAVGISLLTLLASSSAFAQDSVAQNLFADAPMPAAEFASAPVSFTPIRADVPHRFWDKQNCALFLAAAGSNFADFGVTHMNLQNGGRELNPVVRPFTHSTPALAMNFAGETIGAVGLSYFFHRSGHHRLERLVSVVDIGGSLGAVTFGLIHR
jgi:hypothetical protein